MAIRKNVFLNGLGQLGNSVVHTVDQLLMVPFFLMKWGAAYYGEWLTLSIIPTVLGYTDLGFATAISNKFVLSYSNDDKQEAANVLKTGIAVITLVILVGCALCILVLLGLQNSDFIARVKIPHHQVAISIMFLMCGRLIAFFSQLFSGIFRAKHKADLAYHFSSVNGILKIVVGLSTLLGGCGIVGFSFGQLVVSILYNFFLGLYSTRLVKDLPQGYRDREIAVSALKIGFGYLLSPVWQCIYIQGTTFAVRLALGPVGVAAFSTVRTVCNSVHTVFVIVCRSISPELQIAYGKKDMQLVRRLFNMSMQIVLILSLLGFVFLVLFGQQLYMWWTHNELQVSYSVWCIFMIGIPMNSLWWTAGSLFGTINKPIMFSLCGFIASLVALYMTFTLSGVWYMEGAAVGYVVMDFLMLPMLLFLAMRELNVGFKEMFQFGNLNNEVRRVFNIK